MLDQVELQVAGHIVSITHPEKPLWPEISWTKLDYIRYLIEVAPYFLAYARERLLTTIRYPHGIDGEPFFYQKNIPIHAPDWIETHSWRGTKYIVVQNLATLLW